MKRTNFLAKLKKQGKLGTVEPSEEIGKSYTEKSESYLVSAKILFRNNKLEETISLAYYSMYHILLAVLFRTGIKSENHTASIILLKELFGMDNSDILEAKKERIRKQYYVDSRVTESDVKGLLDKAEDFHKNLKDFTSKLSNERVMKYRGKFKTLVK